MNQRRVLPDHFALVRLTSLLLLMLGAANAEAASVQLHVRAGVGPGYISTETTAQQAYTTEQRSAEARYRVVYGGLGPMLEGALGLRLWQVRLGLLAELSHAQLQETGDAARAIDVSGERGESTRWVLSAFAEWKSKHKPWFVGISLGRAQIDGSVCCIKLDTQARGEPPRVYAAGIGMGVVAGAEWLWTRNWSGRLALRTSWMATGKPTDVETLSSATGLLFSIAWH